jgi:hypothetical protein
MAKKTATKVKTKKKSQAGRVKVKNGLQVIDGKTIKPAVQYHRGRPRLWESVEDFERAVKRYFADKEITHTWSGLALHLGFTSRQSLQDYKSIDGFQPAIDFALLNIEVLYEERMQWAKNPAGAIFALKNFGWKDKQEITGIPPSPMGGIIIQVMQPKEEDE